MRNLSKYFTGILAASLLVGCSDDNLGPDDKNNSTSHPEDAVYMQVTVKKITATPGGSRSKTDDPNDDDYSTSNDGIEVGHEDENQIYNVMLILADENNNFISYALVGGLKDNNNNLPGKPPVTNNNSVTLTASFNRQNIDDYYTKYKPTTNPTVRAFALCNYTQDMLNAIKATTPFTNDWTELSQKVVEYSPTSGMTNEGVSILDTKGGLYMANATIATKTFPKTAEEWDAYTTEKTPFDLSGSNGTGSDLIDNSGSILVERGVARFDFADGSKGKNQEYVVGTIKEKPTNPDDPDSEPIIKETLKVKLKRMALVNMNKEFYYLRHVAPSNEDGNAALLDNAVICEPEQPWDRGMNGNWVVGSDAIWKNEYAGGTDEFKHNKTMLNEHFNFALGNGEGATWSIDPTARKWWYNQTIEEVLSKREDNHETWNNDNTHLDYHIWRYVTENAIPSIDGQENGVSTGVVFKAQILPMNDTPDDLKAALNGEYKNPDGTPDNPILYVFDNVIYVKWTQIRAEALNQKAGSPLFNAVFGNSSMSADGTVKDEDLDEDCAEALYKAWVGESTTTPEPSGTEFEAFRDKVVSEKIAIYQYSSEEVDAKDSENGKGGYFCYYYYWNRHNSNGRNGVMGPMEFQVVRNNVYKLAVTEISKLGHPRKTENDPDPEDPDNPDEESNVYFKVRVEVLPWVVRVNNIEF